MEPMVCGMVGKNGVSDGKLGKSFMVTYRGR